MFHGCDDPSPRSSLKPCTASCKRTEREVTWTGWLFVDLILSGFICPAPSVPFDGVYPHSWRTPKINTRTTLSTSHDFVQILHSASTVLYSTGLRNAVFLVIYRTLYSSPWISNRFAHSVPLRSITFCIVIHRLYRQAVAMRSHRSRFVNAYVLFVIDFVFKRGNRHFSVKHFCDNIDVECQQKTKEWSPRLRNWHLRSLHDCVIARCYQETIIRIPRLMTKQDIEI